MIRTRTIREAAAYFKETDPDTCLTEIAIRTLLRTGAVPSARIGKKYLVAIEAFGWTQHDGHDAECLYPL